MDDVREHFEYHRNPIKAIRNKCKDCTNNQISEIDNCTVKMCPLFPFRFGKNPFRQKREVTEEQRQAAKERFAKAREIASLQKEPL